LIRINRRRNPARKLGCWHLHCAFRHLTHAWPAPGSAVLAGANGAFTASHPIDCTRDGELGVSVFETISTMPVILAGRLCPST
jgi:hypothetical protein